MVPKVLLINEAFQPSINFFERRTFSRIGIPAFRNENMKMPGKVGRNFGT